jgi:hypothetical protein
MAFIESPPYLFRFLRLPAAHGYFKKRAGGKPEADFIGQVGRLAGQLIKKVRYSYS